MAQSIIERFCLDRAAFMFDPGETVVLKAKNTGGLGVTWRSENSEVADVTQCGAVTAIADGDTLITASLENGLSYSCIASVGYKGQNPTLPPSWNLFIADGEPHVFDGKLYIYGSRDCPNGYMEGAPKNDWCSDDYHIIWTEDMIHWTDTGVSISINDIPEEMRGNGTRLWAPDLFKGPRDGKYYLTFCTNSADVFIAEGEAPEGPFTNIRKITLGDETICSIDPAVLVDEDGSVYIALPSEFFIAKLDPEDYSRILPESKVILRQIIDDAQKDYFPFEGPSLRKRNGIYYYIYIASRKGENVPTRIDYLMSEEPLNVTAWRFGGSIIETRDFIRAGNIHGSFTEFGDEWYLSYHRMAQGYERFTRMMNLDKMFFNYDGTVVPVVRTSSGVRGFFPAGETIHAASACIFSGGRLDNRFVRSTPNEKDSPFPYAYVKLDTEFYAGYRYVEITSNTGFISLHYRSDSTAVVSITLVSKYADADDTETVSFAIKLPPRICWSTVRVPLETSYSGIFEARFLLVSEGHDLNEEASAQQNSFDLAWFIFS